MILAIDTSTSFISLAVYDGVSILGETTWVSPLRHTTSLAPAVSNLLGTLELPHDKLKAVAIAAGPGSFTSLRVGMSFAKGLAAGLNIPAIGVPSFDILATAFPRVELPLYAVLQAGREKLAVQQYVVLRDKWRPKGEIQVYTAVALAEAVTESAMLCGEFSVEQRAVLRANNKLIRFASPAFCLRRAGFLAELAWKRYEKGDFPPASELAPIYLHTTDPIPTP